MNDRNGKPILILPPAPTRWGALESLLDDHPPLRVADLRARLSQALPHARDAVAAVLDGGRALAVAAIARRDDVGVLTSLYTRPDARRRGIARRLMQTLLAWFDTTGGHWLFTNTTADLIPALYEPFGFCGLHRTRAADHFAASSADTAAAGEKPVAAGDNTADAVSPAITMLRAHGTVGDRPFLTAAGGGEVVEITRADWPLMVAMLQFLAGPDPRVPLAESAISAESVALEFLSQQDRGIVLLRGIRTGTRLTALATLAIDQLGQRSYGAILPHDGETTALREAVLALAASRGYSQVDFPFEALRG